MRSTTMNEAMTENIQELTTDDLLGVAGGSFLSSLGFFLLRASLSEIKSPTFVDTVNKIVAGQ